MQATSPLVHPGDGRRFALEALDRVRRAVAEFSWLLSRDYSAAAALKLVGDRYALDVRQRAAVSRSACTDGALTRRRAHERSAAQVHGLELRIDGYNVLTTLRVALAGGVVLLGRDGCYRDLASVHGRHHDPPLMSAALDCIATVVSRLRLATCHWYLERRVPRSAELAQRITAAAEMQGRIWPTHLVPDADAALLGNRDTVATSDSRVLDGCESWINLTRCAIEGCVPAAHRVDLG